MKSNNNKNSFKSFSDLGSNMGGIVYSTNPDYKPPTDDITDDVSDGNTIPPNQQDLRITLEKYKGNKKATIVYQFKGTDDELETLGKHLKTKCGVGGSVKNGEIILQGNCIDKIKSELTTLGYKFKVAGV